MLVFSIPFHYVLSYQNVSKSTRRVCKIVYIHTIRLKKFHQSVGSMMLKWKCVSADAIRFLKSVYIFTYLSIKFFIVAF